MRQTHIVAGLLAVLPIASALSEQFCVTLLGPSKVKKVSTTTVTSTIDFDLHETFHTSVLTTTTPVVSVTAIETDTTSTTASTITDVFSITVTNTLTETDSTTVTDTASATTTVTSTTTPVLSIAANPSFTPILSEAEVIPYERRRRTRHSREKYEFSEAELEERSKRSKAVAQPLGSNLSRSKTCPVQYPQSVQCFKFVENIIIEKTTITTTNTATASTSTNTITDTTTTTNTIVPPDASTTVTQTTSTTTTTTTTDTTTTTSTETDVTTVAAPTATAYAQCGTNNVVGLIGGLSIISVYGYVGTSQMASSSAAACCASCSILGNTCTNFIYYGGQCYLVNGPATCSANTRYTLYSQITPGNGAELYIIGNGACGLTDITRVN